jgi:hypothetical protein
MSDLPRVFERLARRTAEEIVSAAGETDEEIIAELTEFAEQTNGHLLTKTTLEGLVPLDYDPDGPGAEAVDKFWALFRQLVVAELKLELEPFRKSVKAEWDRRNKAVKEGREW